MRVIHLPSRGLRASVQAIRPTSQFSEPSIRINKTLTTEDRKPVAQLDGTLYLYEQPELLSRDAHGSLGINRIEHPYKFARDARVLPLTLPEMATAQMHYPIIFTDPDNPLPLAAVGANADNNLFVDDDGRWASGVYVPAYARCYPFSLAAAGTGDQFAAVIDRAAEMISDNPEQPFFDGDNVTPQTQAMIDFCGRYDAERRRTLEFGRKLAELGLLAGHKAARTSHAGEQETIANYIAVDRGKLRELGAEIIEELMQNEYLECIYAHLFSLENWSRLIERRNKKHSGPGG